MVEEVCPFDDCPMRRDVEALRAKEQSDAQSLSEMLENIRSMVLTLQERTARLASQQKLLPELLRDREKNRTRLDENHRRLQELAKEEAEHHGETRRLNTRSSTEEQRLEKLEALVHQNSEMLRQLLKNR